MIAYVFFAKKVAMPRLEALRGRASHFAQKMGLDDPWCHCGHHCVAFGFEDGLEDNKGRTAANQFAFDCKEQRIPCKADWVG
jgi:hypothetical protein